MLGLVISTGIVVEPPSSGDDGFITRHHVRIVALERDENSDGGDEDNSGRDESSDKGNEHADDPPEIGSAVLAIVHVGAIWESGVDLGEVLDGARDDLKLLHELFFDGGSGRYVVEQAPGVGLAYIESLSIDAEWRGRNIDLAVVYRLRQTLAEGCRFLVLRCEDGEEIGRWTQIGFQRSNRERNDGFLHLAGRGHPRVVPHSDDEHRFRVVARTLDLGELPEVETEDGVMDVAPSSQGPHAHATPPPAGRRRGSPRRR